MINPMRLCFSLYQKVIEKLYSCQKKRGTILMFHDVYLDNEVPKKPNVAISTSNFIRLIDIIGENNLQKKVSCYRDLFLLGENDVIITFDDVLKSVIDNALPILREKKIPYIVFIATEFIGKQGYISSEDIDLLKKDPLCVIGSHSVQHKKYRFFPDELVKDAKISSAFLEASLFAYPYGSLFAVSMQNIKEIESSGVFSCAFSTISAPLTRLSVKKRWMLPRINVNDDYVNKGE